MKWLRNVGILCIGLLGPRRGLAQAWDSVWVSLAPAPPYSPSTVTQISVGDTLFLRIGFSSGDTLTQFATGLTYDTRKFEVTEMGFDVVDASTGQAFDPWSFWDPTSFSQPCGISIGDSLCVATWFGMTLLGNLFALSPGQWMVGTLKLVATEPGPTVLLPVYLDTTEFKIPIPLMVDIQTSVNETPALTEPKPRLFVRYDPSQRSIIFSVSFPLQLSLDLVNVAGQEIFGTSLTVHPPETVLPLPLSRVRRGVYFLRVQAQSGEVYIVKLWVN